MLTVGLLLYGFPFSSLCVVSAYAEFIPCTHPVRALLNREEGRGGGGGGGVAERDRQTYRQGEREREISRKRQTPTDKYTG